ncbi:MAG: hypothetical protein JST54_27590 [Deltaproteobacteria bacterium]|nr:hypothetical protein [Deltaproteobacteria bacterium]
MNRLITAALLLTPTLALAAPILNEKAPDPALKAKMEKRMHTMRTIGLAEALDLDANAALQLDAAMTPFDERRKPLHEQLKASKQILDRAADGDPSAAGQVDSAIQQAFDARAQLEQIDRDMLLTVSKGMAPAQKAKLSVFLAHFKHEMMERMHGGREGKWRGAQGGPGFQE